MLHLKLLAKCINSVYLQDVNYIKKYIDACINLVNMRPLDKPQIFNVPLQIEKLNLEPFEDEGGITAQLIGILFYLQVTLLFILGR